MEYFLIAVEMSLQPEVEDQIEFDNIVRTLRLKVTNSEKFKVQLEQSSEG